MIWTGEERRELVRRWLASGMTAAAFVRAHEGFGISAGALRWWWVRGLR